jgi:hypothetical protein
MSTSIDSIKNEISELRKDMELVKHILKEDTELSEDAKKQLADARATPESEYIDLE